MGLTKSPAGRRNPRYFLAQFLSRDTAGLLALSWHQRMRAHRAPLELFGRLRLQADALEAAAKMPARALPILMHFADRGPVPHARLASFKDLARPAKWRPARWLVGPVLAAQFHELVRRHPYRRCRPRPRRLADLLYFSRPWRNSWRLIVLLQCPLPMRHENAPAEKTTRNPGMLVHYIIESRFKIPQGFYCFQIP